MERARRSRRFCASISESAAIRAVFTTLVLLGVYTPNTWAEPSRASHRIAAVIDAARTELVFSVSEVELPGHEIEGMYRIDPKRPFPHRIEDLAAALEATSVEGEYRLVVAPALPEGAEFILVFAPEGTTDCYSECIELLLQLPFDPPQLEPITTEDAVGEVIWKLMKSPLCPKDQSFDENPWAPCLNKYSFEYSGTRTSPQNFLREAVWEPTVNKGFDKATINNDVELLLYGQRDSFINVTRAFYRYGSQRITKVIRRVAQPPTESFTSNTYGVETDFLFTDHYLGFKKSVGSDGDWLAFGLVVGASFEDDSASPKEIEVMPAHVGGQIAEATKFKLRRPRMIEPHFGVRLQGSNRRHFGRLLFTPAFHTMRGTRLLGNFQTSEEGVVQEQPALKWELRYDREFFGGGLRWGFEVDGRFNFREDIERDSPFDTRLWSRLSTKFSVPIQSPLRLEPFVEYLAYQTKLTELGAQFPDAFAGERFHLVRGGWRIVVQR